MEDADKLREIAVALREWGKFNNQNTKEAKDATRKAMRLLVDNLELLHHVEIAYGCHAPLQQYLKWFDDAASWPDTKDLGDYWNWCKEFTHPHLWDSERRSLIDELNRWANKLEQEKNRTNTTSAKGRGIWTLVKKIPRWIYLLVIFLSALLAIVYYLWWLWATFWKK